MKMSMQMHNRGNRPGKAENGFSMVEIMVGLVIGMLAILVMMQVFSVSEGQKRTTTGAGDAQQNGSYAMYLLESHLRAVGSGFAIATTPNLLGCPIGGVPAPAFMVPVPPALRMIPALITDGGGGSSDSITMMFGTAAGIANRVGFSAAAGVGATAIQATSTFGFKTNDLVLGVEQVGVVPAICTIARVTADPAENVPGPIAVTPLTGAYSASALLVNLGPGPDPNVAGDQNANGPVLTQLAVRNNPPGSASFSLAALDVLGRPPGLGAPTVLVDNVVNIQAQYGVDTTLPVADDVIDAWVEPTGPWAAAALTPLQISQIKAIRIGIVVRSGLMEKKTPGGVCTTTTIAPVPLPGAPAAGPIPAKPAAPAMDTTGITDFGCYRYKVFETVIPVRNVIWGA